MNFKIIIVMVFLFIKPVSSFAGNDNYIPDIPPGVKIVPVSEIGLTAEEKREDKQKKLMRKKLGYVETSSQDARELLNMGKKGYIFSEKNEVDPYGSDIKRSLSNIKLAFPFNGVSFIKPENIIGFAVAGTYINGWTGIAEYFNYKKIGACQYLLNNVEITRGGILLRDDIVRFDINNKPTNINVKGSKQSGFLYTVKWYDKKYFHELHCANQNFDKGITKKMIVLANQIDKDKAAFKFVKGSSHASS